MEIKEEIFILKGNVMKYFKPGEQMRMMYYSAMTQANSEKRNSECSYHYGTNILHTARIT